MAEVTATLVKDLREKTGAGMMDCKRALSETAGDSEAAVDWLRKKGLAAAAKKAGRAATEGLVGVLTDGPRGAIVEVNSETDFVARNELFQAFARTATRLALEGGSDNLGDAAYPGTGRTVSEEATQLIATVGENIHLRRAAHLAVPNGVVAGYVHNQVVAGVGKIGVLVGLQSAAEPDALAGLGRQLAMHVAASQPQFVSIEAVDPTVLERERTVLSDQARASGRPEEIIAKMVEGRLRKFYEEVVLLEQTFVIDGESKVAKVIEAAAKEFGTPVTVAGFVRFTLGEGVAKNEEDFAAEVAKLAG